MGVTPVIVVHVGAGKHSKLKELDYKNVCDESCLRTIEKLKQGISAVDAVECAIRILENSKVTNAGIGSYLNRDGLVECDASIMDGDSGLIGCVGAVPGVKNPITLAKVLLKEQKTTTKLISPIILSGIGALKYAKNHSELEDNVFEDWDSPCNGPLVTNQSIRVYEAHKLIMNNSSLGKNFDTETHDTVGAIAIDLNGNIAAGVSSGGISLKYPGRIGDSAIPGSGIWVKNVEIDSSFKVGCCTTGTGEQLISFDFARNFCNELYNKREVEDRCEVIKSLMSNFVSIPFSHPPAAGFISLILEEERFGEFWYGFSTESMGIGFQCATDPNPKSFIDRLSNGNKYRISCISFP